MKKSIPIPNFSRESDERKFWQTADSTDYIDWTKANQSIFSNLKPSTKTISLRLPEILLDDLKVLAHKQDIPYQSFMKVLLNEGVERRINH